MVTPQMLVSALCSEAFPATLALPERLTVEHFKSTVRTVDQTVLFAGIRRFLAPRDMLVEATAVTYANWALCKELYLGKLFVNRAVPTSILDRLSDPKHLGTRAEWAEAFGLSLARRTSWRAFGVESATIKPLQERVARNGGRLVGLSLREVLTLALPMPTIGEGWGSPLSWFTLNSCHFAEVLTAEGVRALAAYLARRSQELGGAPIVEVGAGTGRLSHFLNATGLLPPPGILATEPDPAPANAPKEARSNAFRLAQLDDMAVLKRFQHSLPLVLCAWMDFGCDWTPVWREAGVPEYVLIGELGKRPPPPAAAGGPPGGGGNEGFMTVSADGSKRFVTAAEYKELAGTACYSLNLDPGPRYERVLLEDVSSEMLHIKDAQDAEEGENLEEQEGVAAAVAFRRRIGHKRS